MNAVGRAQSRYLWVLLLVALFYPAVTARFAAPGVHPILKVPVVGLEFDAGVVLASGPAVIALVVLIVMGSLRAIEVAIDHIDPVLEVPGEMERFDEHPNALDLAFYTTADSPRFLAGA